MTIFRYRRRFAGSLHHRWWRIIPLVLLSLVIGHAAAADVVVDAAGAVTLPAVPATGSGTPAATRTVTIHITLTRQPPPVAAAWAEGVNDWSAEDVTVDQRNRTFVPEIVACPPGGRVLVNNHDDQQHNVFVLDQRLGLNLDLGLGQPGSSLPLPVTWPADEVVRCGCKIHPTMRLWVATIPTHQNTTLSWPGTVRTATLSLAITTGVVAVRVWTPKTDTTTVPVPGQVDLHWKNEVVGTVVVSNDG